MNLLDLILKSQEEIEAYLGDVPAMQFIEDVKQSLSTYKADDRKKAAMAAMQGICAKYNDDDKYHVNGGWLHPETVAKSAIEIAEELLKQLES